MLQAVGELGAAMATARRGHGCGSARMERDGFRPHTRATVLAGSRRPVPVGRGSGGGPFVRRPLSAPRPEGRPWADGHLLVWLLTGPAGRRCLRDVLRKL